MRHLLILLCLTVGVHAIAQAPYEETMSELAKDLNVRIAESNAGNVLISEFKRMVGEPCELGSTLTLDLETAISELSKPYKLLDRQNLEAMAEEHKLDMQGLMDDEQSMREACKLLKTDILVFGYYTYTADGLVLRLKAVDIQTAEQVVVLSRNCLPNTILKVMCKGTVANKPSAQSQPREKNDIPPVPTARVPST